ncbi:MAG: laccase domain-containing protein [Deferribacterales bacterium]|nr:laccase domain-containing protein [Deferribacterales bacterium]
MNKSFIYAKNTPDDILAFTSTKYGGYSKGRYSSLNTGLFTNDDKKSVLKNIEYLKSFHNIDKLCFLNQVHGTQVHHVNHSNFADVYLSDGDGLFTGERGIALGVFTADCYPVLLSGNTHLAALHCGWRSLNAEIIENAVELFIKNHDYPYYAYVGPGICNKCYEVTPEIFNKLNPKYNPHDAIVKNNNGKYTLNLRNMVETALKINKISRYVFAEESSCCSELFFSYRKYNGDTGRMLSVIVRR